MPNSYFYSLLPEGVSREFADNLISQYDSPEVGVAQRGVGDPERFYPYLRDGNYYIGYGTYVAPAGNMTEQQAMLVQSYIDEGITVNDAHQKLANGLTEAQNRIQSQAARGNRSVPTGLMQELISTQYQDPSSDLTDDVWNAIQSQDYLKTGELLAQKAPQQANLIQSTVPAKTDDLGVLHQIASRTGASEVRNFTSLTDGASAITPDTGGTTSYGWMGLNTGLNTERGSIDEFVERHGATLGLTADPGTEEFAEQWRNADPNASNQAQLSFFEETRVNPARDKLAEYGLGDLAEDAGVLNTVADSLVQLGGLTDGHLRQTAEQLRDNPNATRDDFFDTYEQVQIANLPNNFQTALGEGSATLAGLTNRVTTRVNNGRDFLGVAPNGAPSPEFAAVDPAASEVFGFDPDRVAEVPARFPGGDDAPTIGSGFDPSFQIPFFQPPPAGGDGAPTPVTAADIADLDAGVQDGSISFGFDPSFQIPFFQPPSAGGLDRLNEDFQGVDPFIVGDNVPQANEFDGATTLRPELAGVEPDVVIPQAGEFGENERVFTGDPRPSVDRAPRLRSFAQEQGINITPEQAQAEAERLAFERLLADEAAQGDNVRALAELRARSAAETRERNRIAELQAEDRARDDAALGISRAGEDQFLSGAQLAAQALGNVDTSGLEAFLTRNEGTTRISGSDDTFSLGAIDGVDLLTPSQFNSGLVTPARDVFDAQQTQERLLADQVLSAEQRSLEDTLVNNEILQAAQQERNRRLAVGDVNTAALTLGNQQVNASTGIAPTDAIQLAQQASALQVEDRVRNGLGTGAVELGGNQAEVDTRTRINNQARQRNEQTRALLNRISDVFGNQFRVRRFNDGFNQQ